MKKTPENQKVAGRNKNGLRLINCEKIDEEVVEEIKRPALNNPLVKFMGAFADSIDDDIKRIMDL
jgi:hypothetical protein